MSAVAAVWRFLADLVIGDDPRIAATVVSVLAVGAGLIMTETASASVIMVMGAVILVLGFGLCVAADARGESPQLAGRDTQEPGP
ncbi:MAG: hypothetical protein ACR2GB_00490 [Nocardioidaceae bacterium]